MPKTKIVDRETLPYRPCVGLMILNGEGLVWVGHRIAEPDSEFAGTTQLWQMPQGGIDKGEEPLQAAERELYEETGMRRMKRSIPVYPVKGYSITVPIKDAALAPVSTVMDETFKVAVTRLGDRIRVGGTAEIVGYNLKLRQGRRDTLDHE